MNMAWSISLLGSLSTLAAAAPECSSDLAFASPAALVASPDGGRLFVACATANQVAVYDPGLLRVERVIPVPSTPTGVALSKDGFRLFVTCAAPASLVCVIDTAAGQIADQIPVGHTAMSPILSPDERILYVCNRFNHDVSVIDLAQARELARIPVQREPISAALERAGKYLIVANHLHRGPANVAHAVPTVSVIDTSRRQVVKDILLPLGSSLVRAVAVSPDGQFAAVTHLRAMHWFTTSSLALGRMNANAVTFLHLKRLRVLGTVLLDQSTRGAANPWAVAWTPDGKTVAVTLAGTHELCLLDAPVDANPWNFAPLELSRYALPENGDLPAPTRPVRVRQRVALEGSGPRALAVAGDQLYVANYFSDDLNRIDLAQGEPSVERLPFWPAAEPTAARMGEQFFNDARLCAQGWQSCASCHDSDARADALNWDLLNDGAGNPKNTKSLLGAPETAPAMALGIRTNAAAAVRAGLHHILFTDQDEEVAAAIEAYLQSLRPVPSPHSNAGARLTCAARRGEKLFLSARTGCAECHPPPLWTDLEAHDVGTQAAYRGMWDSRGADHPGQRFDTPGLQELWRTAPYLHDGSAATLRELLTKNWEDQHGRTSHLTPSEIDDLVAFLESL